MASALGAALVAALVAALATAACDAAPRDRAAADAPRAVRSIPMPPGVTAVDGATHAGACDASAAVLAAPGVVLVASDEDDVIRAYALADAASPLATFDLAPILAADGARDEADLEGAARVGDTVYWIGSHSLDRRGRVAPNRRQLVATTVHVDGGRIALAPLGRPYRGLLAALVADTALARFGLAAAATRGAEEAGGLNVEGLAATPDGALLVGFRNPVPEGRALVVPIENPGELVRSPAARARLGAPVTLDLGGLGIRDIAYWPARGVYVVVAGASGGASAFRLYTWAGGAAPARLVADVGALGLSPEALVVEGGTAGRIALLSDDGNRRVGTTRCKELAGGWHASRMRFRSAWVTVR